MTDRPRTMSDADLEAALYDLAGALAPASAPDLAGAVRLRVERLGSPATRRPHWLDRFTPSAGRRVGVPPGGRALRRSLVLAVAALLIVAGIAAAIGYGLPGLRIVILGPVASARPTSPIAGSIAPSAVPSLGPTFPATSETTPQAIESLGLGIPVDRSAADAAAGYRVRLARLPELGRLLAIYVRGGPPGAWVSAAYAAAPSLPAASDGPSVSGTPVAILVMEFPGQSDAGSLQKMLPEGTTIEPVIVAGHQGFWISGRPHDLLVLRSDGSIEQDTVRLVGNVLAWNDGSLTFRIEGASDLATAQRIAESIR